MQYENKILVSAILIIGVALVSFNVLSPNISGRVSHRECSPIEVSVDLDGPWLNMRVEWEPSPPGTNYNGVHPSNKEVIERRLSGAKVADIRIPRDVLDDNPMIFRVRESGGLTEGWAGVRDKCTGEEVRDRF